MKLQPKQNQHQLKTHIAESNNIYDEMVKTRDKDSYSFKINMLLSDKYCDIFLRS